MDNKEVVSTLNELIETCRDGQNGFKEAAENVKNPELKSFFTQASAERAQFVRELEVEVRRFGGDPEKSGSASAAVHRVWMDLKGTFTGKDDHSILAECERGEDSAVETYQEAIKKGISPPNILTLVEQQFQNIRQTHDRVKQMRDAKAATSRK